MTTPSSPASTTASTTASTNMTEAVQLAPSYAIPLGLVLISIPLVFVQPWVSAGMSLFGVFLLYQTTTLRLWFMETALDVYRGETLIRRFPYQDWQTWAIFWPPVPILFYFKEVKSIHFLPILFDPKALRACLEERVPCDR